MVQLKNNKMVNCKCSLLQEDVFNVFVLPSEVVEVRLLNVWGNSPAWAGFVKWKVSEYFDCYRSFGNANKMAVKKQLGIIYFTLQVIDPRLKGRRTSTNK